MTVKRNTTKSTKVQSTAVVEKSTAVDNDISVDVKNTVLNDSDEIEIVSLIPNVSYEDNRTGDFYIWDEVGHIEYMTFETIKNLWRNHRGYFKNLCLRPLDDRVVDKLGLKSTYDKYEFIMDEKNYTINNVSKICDTYNSMPNDLKYSLCTKIKNLVATEKIIDNRVIKQLKDILDIVLE